MYAIATEAQWIDGKMGKSAIANMFQFHNVEELVTIVNSRNKVKEFSRAACFRVTRDTKTTVVPAGLTKLFGAETQRQALDNKRPAMIRIIYQYLNRVSVFGVKEGMSSIFEAPTAKLRELITTPGSVLIFLRQKGILIEYDPPKVILEEDLLLASPIKSRLKALSAPNSVICFETGKVRMMDASTHTAALHANFNQYLRTIVPETSVTMLAPYKSYSIDMKFKCIFQEGFFIKTFRDLYPFLDEHYVPPTKNTPQPRDQSPTKNG